MNHEEAIQANAVEAYVLGEMPAPERDSFEEHYFGCAACFDALQQAETFAQNARLAARHPKSQPETRTPKRPFEPLVRWAAPIAAAVAIVAVLGPGRVAFQGPALQQGADDHRPAVSLPLRHVRAANDQSTPAYRRSELQFDVPKADGAVSYVAIARGSDGREIAHIEITTEEAENTVEMPLRPLPPGGYELVIENVDSGGKRSPNTSYPFEVVVSEGLQKTATN